MTTLVAAPVAFRIATPDTRLPVFQPSEADPASGYRARPVAIEFTLGRAVDCRLRIEYAVPAARFADLQVLVNRASGYVYPRPAPADTPLGAGAFELVLPKSALRRGVNRVELVARDGAAVTRIDNPEKVQRLDPGATPCGLTYTRIELAEIEGAVPRVTNAELIPTILYVRDAGGILRERCIVAIALGGPVAAGRARVRSGDVDTTFAVDAMLGEVQAFVDVADGDGEIGYDIAIDADGASYAFRGRVARRRKWRVYAAPHAHTDIGYTHRQSEVAERLARNLDAALGLVATQDYAYHLDSAWTLEHWRATRGARHQHDLAEAIARGRIGVSASYVDLLTQLPTAEGLVRNIALGHELVRDLGGTAAFASIVDVPSATASLPAILSASGVRYLAHASNQDRGPFLYGGGLHRRGAFWWGPHRSRVLVWMSLGYCELRKICGSPASLRAAERGLELFLQRYDTPDYAPDAVFMYGQEADNTDLDPQPAEFIAQWNATYAYPRLIACEPSAFFRDVEQRFGPLLPSMSGDGGAYWEDGALSSTAETIAVRAAEAALPAAERLAALAAMHEPDARFPLARFDDAWRNVLLYAEHTWGAYLSTTEPEARLTKDQWSAKRHFAREAERLASDLLHQAASTHALRLANAGREIVVHNPHSWRVSGTATVEVAADEVPVDAEHGSVIPHRRVKTLATQALIELEIRDLPGLSLRRHPLRRGDAPAQTRQPLSRSITLENARHRLTIDATRGCAVGWRDKRLDRELVASDRFGLGQFVYVQGGEGTRIARSDPRLPLPELEILDGFRLIDAEFEHSAIADRVRVSGEVAFGEAEFEWSLPRDGAHIEVALRYRKRATFAKEAAYVAFPLALDGARVRSDSQLGWIDWDRERLPGAGVEWLPLQTAVWLEDADASVALASPDVPLFCSGDIVRGTWATHAPVRGGRVFSYLLNNYWHTNYRAAQSGDIVVRYRLLSDRAIDAARAHRFGWEARRPLFGQRMSFQDFRAPEPPYDAASTSTFARVEPETVALSTLVAARDGEGWVVRVQEIAGRECAATIEFSGLHIARAWRCDHLERAAAELAVGEKGELRVSLGPWQLATIRLILAR